ncbi:autotransporter outer membrane beta-barrel domain-containing protein [Serratia microhaemolytica]|uniref:autotransporter outer membrane beta-barrel domain-containing protein n=1 Tax=Serratia microhaemolytica TaxID=2675110 RepID=UPI001F0BC893|nr:autotransporter outer membrane beta-barrel domain-containing protein [Serratia microhaemolytica]
MTKPNRHPIYRTATKINLLIGSLIVTSIATAAPISNTNNTPNSPQQIDTRGDTQIGDITAINDTGTLDQTIVTDDVEGYIKAENRGTGDQKITTGNVTSTAANSTAITANNIDNDGGLSITTGEVIGQRVGISASNSGTGSLSIKAKKVSASRTAINAVNQKNSLLEITVTENVEAPNGNGIVAVNSAGSDSGSGSTVINVHDVTAQSTAITASNAVGTLTITSSGTLYAKNGAGLAATGEDKEITIDVNQVQGGTFGIQATNTGTGTLSITAKDVEARAATGKAIEANNTGDGLSITVENAEGVNAGIDATNSNNGALSINSSGRITASNGTAIIAENRGSDLKINVNDVSATDTAIEANNLGSGQLSITSTGTITAKDANGVGINATNQAAGSDLLMEINNVTAALTAVMANNAGRGKLSIRSTGTITATDATNGVGINATNQAAGSDLLMEINNVTAALTAVIADNSGTGQLSIKSTGTITATDATAGVGIKATNRTDGGDLILDINNVAAELTGIFANNQSSARAVSITSRGEVTGRGQYGIEAKNSGNSSLSLNVEQGSLVQGGVAAIDIESNSATTLTNHGTIQNLSGEVAAMALKAESSELISLNNHGVLVGRVNLATNSSSVINQTDGIWYTAGSSDFGLLNNNNQFTNHGTIIIGARTPDSASSTPRVPDSASTPTTTEFNRVDNFRNFGTLSMVNGVAGDVTTIDGNYIGEGGELQFDAVLEGDNSLVDKLIINGNSSGTSYVHVNNLGGNGAQTIEGLNLIYVNGLSEGEFVQRGRIVAGAYDYSLVRGLDALSNHWYLTSKPSQDGSSTRRPEEAIYSSNLAAANTLFIGPLFERAVGSSYIDPFSGAERYSSLWIHNEGGHNRYRDESGQLRTRANRYMVQLGGSLAEWGYRDQGRFSLGIMAGYGRSSSSTESNRSGYRAQGEVDGYSAGLYGTWQADAEKRLGSYMAGWVQYNWFDNRVSGQDLPQEKYKSRGFSAALESGYNLKLAENSIQNFSWYLQPQAQLYWMGVKADSHTEANGTRVNSKGDGNIRTRLGVKTALDGTHKRDKDKQRSFQPFLEANWIYNSKDFASEMDGTVIKQDGAGNLAELKIGLDGQLNSNINIFSNISQQVGDKGYSDTAAKVGVKYRF